MLRAPLAVAALLCLLLAGCGSPSSSVTTGITPKASSPTSPSTVPDRLTIAALRARTYTASRLTSVRSDGDQGGYTNTVASFKSDGLTEYALVSIPDGQAPAGGWPVIILCHGYIDPSTYVTDDGSYAQFIAAFARAGYAVVKPDFRGHGKSQGTPEGGHFSPVYTYDVLNLVATLKADSRFDGARIGLFAHSMGGHVALRALVVSHDIKAAVFMAGVVGSFNDIFYNWPNSPVLSDRPAVVQQIRQSEISAHGTPKQNPAYWNSASAINDVDSITAAVQINVDVNDSVVPPLFSDHLNAALVAAHKTVDFRSYPGDDHQFSANRAAILANAVSFYHQHL